MTKNFVLMTSAAMPLALLAACGGGGGNGGGGGIVSTLTPPSVAVAPPSPPPPPPAPTAVSLDTAEYRRSNAAVQAQALAAYNLGATGQGVVVGVIDSGVNANSSEFAGRISAASNDFAGTRGIQDEGGHGTAVSGVILAARNDAGSHGIAYNATLLALRTDTPGSCATQVANSDEGGCTHNDNAIAAALDAAVAARARVVNISLGGSPANMQLRGAIDRATAAGTIIVFSAGNEGVSSPTTAINPDMLAQIANDPIARGLVLIVGATDGAGALADFSNRAGNSAANYLTALGVRVRSLDQNGTAYLYSGTSFSAPVVAGAVALIAQAFPSLSPTQIVSLLYRSATDLGTAGTDGTFGNGELNLQRAFQPIGATQMAASATPVSLVSNATLGSAMGDAGQGALAAVVRDEFGRDFDVDLGATVHRSLPNSTLAPAFAVTGRSSVASGGRASIALSVSDTVPRPLTLRGVDAERARVLAGAVAVAIDKNTVLAIGAGRGADGLVVSPEAGNAPAFLVSDTSLELEPLAAFAVRRKLGGIAVRVAVESGDMRLWEASTSGRAFDRTQRYAYDILALSAEGRVGPLALSAGMTRLDERATVLGGRLGPALGGSGAVTWFAEVGAVLTPLDHWRLAASFRRGVTRLDANTARADSTLASQALSAEVSRTSVLTRGDQLSLHYLEPLRVTGGSLALRTGIDATSLSLVPGGHERDWELAYARPMAIGWLSANAYVRRQPSNHALAPDDIGVALRYGFAF